MHSLNLTPISSVRLQHLRFQSRPAVARNPNKGLAHIAVKASNAIIQTYHVAPATAKVAFRTGCYITALGASLLCFPQAVINLFSAAHSVPGVGWIRVGGTLASLFGFYYIGAALDDVEGRFPLRFYQATILGRVFLSAVFSWLVLSGQSERGLLVLALVNLASAWAQHRQVQLRLEEER